MLDRQNISWLARTVDGFAAFNLPASRPDQTGRDPARDQTILLRRPLADALTGFAACEGKPLSAVLLTGFAIFLSRLAGEAEPTAASFCAGGVATSGVIALPEMDMSADPDVRTALARVCRSQITAQAGLAHHDRSSPPRRGHVTEASGPAGQSLGTELPELARSADFQLDIAETDEGVTLSLTDCRGRFDPATIDRFLEAIRTLLEGMVADPSRPISRLPLLDGAERQRLLVEWNATRTDYPRQSCLHTLIEAQANRTPDAVAVVDENQSLTYRELDRRANQLANHLQRRGIGPDRLVGLCLDRSVEMLVGILGVLKAGGAYVPLDPASPADRLAFMVRDSGVMLILTKAGAAGDPRRLDVPLLRLDADWPLIATEPSDPLAISHTADQLAYVIYTSGSTGTPKGVMISHRAVVNHMLWVVRAYALTADDHALQTSSFSFDASVWEIFAPLLTGARLIMARPGALADPAYLVETIRTQAVTSLQLVPSVLQMLVREPGFSGCTSLRHIFAGGEALHHDLAAECLDRTGAALHNTYGPTETTIDATAWHCRRDRPLDRAIPIGRPIDNTQLYILDPNLEPVPVSVPGELYIGGDGLARGYLNRPELTAERFIPHPFDSTPGARLYRTGDRVRYRADGAVEFLGRFDHQIKLRGLRIELGEIESALMAHAAVGSAAVTLHERQPGDPRLVAYLAPHAGQPRDSVPGGRTLRTFLERRLPSYMVPSVFMTLEAMPLLPNAKLDRKALPAPDDRCAEAADHVQPKTIGERLIADIWADLLGHAAFGIHDSFFDIGGHSLLAARVALRLQEATGLAVPIIALFEQPTIAEMARRLDGNAKAASPSMVRQLTANSGAPPFFYLHGDYAGGGTYCLNIARQIGSDTNFFVVQPYLPGDGPGKLGSVEEIATLTLSWLRAVQPAGPYRLGGNCNGGLVAYEMARQLEAAGETTETLILLNTPTYNLRPARKAMHGLLAAFDRFAGTGTSGWFLEAINRLEELVQAHLLRVDYRLFASIRQEVRYLVEKIHMPVRSTDKREAAIAQFYTRALTRYMPGRLTAPVICVLSEKDARISAFEPAYWEAQTGGVELHTVPGDHLSCLTQHVGQLAGTLKRILSEPPSRGPQAANDDPSRPTRVLAAG